MEERLQKFMARCGVASRRKCEEMIDHGMVEVNGEVIREPGVKIDPSRDRIKVNGKVLRTESPVYYIHYKVKGVATTVSDDLGRKTVMDCLPEIRERVYPVGRLDMESEGLLLLTNDGEMANYLTHPAHGVEKTYRVVAEGRIDGDVLKTLAEKGMRLGPVLVRPSRVELVRYDNDNTIVLISVSEGINREVRRIFAALGHEVKKLLRIQVGPLSLAGMRRGATRPLAPKELSLLRKGVKSTAEVDQEEMYPAGSAKSRKPTGPRGRPRHTKAPRQGKPDPAAAKKNAPSKKPAKGMVVEDDWVKRGRNASLKTTRDKAVKSETPAKPSRPLRPVKSSSAKPAAKPKPAPVKPVKIVGHPLLSSPAKDTKKPGGMSSAKRSAPQKRNNKKIGTKKR